MQDDTSKRLRLPRKMTTIPWQCDSHKIRSTTRLESKALRLPRNWRRLRLKYWACHENWNLSSENVVKNSPAIKNDFRRVTKYVWTSRSATHAARNEATRHLRPPKMAPSAEFPIGTAYRDCANGCGRLGSVDRRFPPPLDPRVKWEPCYALGRKCILLYAQITRRLI
jgi:hypothetical protein